jgi:transposase-like protein
MRYRKWTDEQKKRILAQVSAAQREGARGGLQSVLDDYDIKWMHIIRWRKQLGEQNG